MKIEQNVPLSSMTTFKLGGMARFFIAPASVDEIRESLQWAKNEKLEVFVFGKGSNLVISDKGFDGLVINIGKAISHINWEGPHIQAGAGVLLNSLVQQTVARGFTGIERLAGIPGSLGGGVFMNAGAFGQELDQVVTSVRSCTFDGEFVTRTADECCFGYRKSVFNTVKEVILEIEIDLASGNKNDLEMMVSEYLKRRKEKQPLSFPNAGSMFKRPVVGFAGAMIEEAGLKGSSIGGAAISQQHANFIINTGNATAQDVYDLSEDVLQTVSEFCGIKMEKEVRFIGDFLPWPR
ncbi:MAG: UDP-N-acetylmuramate dehydrogenase [Fibrobacteria bacterium]|nr:UDP-N-acetylmuramate dehydrogenase [Fibrobacteria bacterium]